MPPDLMQMYRDVPHPKFLLTVSGGNGQTMHTHGLIRDAIGNYINVEATNFQLGTPPTVECGPNPILWLVAGLPGHLSDELINKKVLSSSHITFYTIPFDIPVMGLVGTFSGFTLPNTQEGADAARSLLQTVIRKDNSIAQFVQTHRNAFGAHVSAEEAWAIFTDSVAVEGIALKVSDTTTIAWQLHVTPPTNDHDAWLQLRRLFGRLYVMTALHGSAKMQHSFKCRICPSTSHPTGLCPFPNLPGWLGPTTQTIAALDDISRQAATKAQEFLRGGAAAGPNTAAPRTTANRGQGTTAANKKPHKGGAKGKKGGDAKGKGKRREYDDFF
ncbi:hypothetical protein B0H14DRAFT_2600460 [Mycena olivaceomarginata]|nr:hypothetical protein B0H14DRAFT_2600460 [Mycena olivaceomarginata]